MKWGLSMNEVVLPRTITATAAVVGLNAALAVGNAVWPAHEPIYVTTQSNPTFSFFEAALAVTPKTSSHDFAQEVAGIFASLSEGQEPLGAEFEAVWDENVDELYQS
jgi:hypothetical protein